MGIFDVFKTKITEAADKVGDVAGDMKDKVTDKMDKKEGAGAGDQMGDAAQTAQDQTGQAGDQMAEGAHNAEEMVSEGSPPMPADSGDGGMTGTIQGNMATGADKAGEFAKDKTGGKFDDKIDSGVQAAKDRLQG